ncbi:MAG: FxSxx-COOH system tetratricopeptide repeat protein [Bacillota bacterium]
MSSTTNPPPNVILSTIWNVPYNRNPNFTGRERQLKEIHRALNSRDPLQRAQAIYGLGGVGKTQLALEYAYRHRDEYAIIWWVRAEEPTTLITDLLRLGTHLSGGTVIDAPPEIICDAIRRALDRRSDWLLIIDNAPSPNVVSHVLPQGRNGNVIITSRNPNWRGVANPYQLGMLERSEAIQFLRKRTGIVETDEAMANRLANALGDLPLALEQAGACIEQARITFIDYLERFETHRQEILRLSPPATDYPDTVATTWDISFEKVSATSRPAGDLLNLCAFLSPDEIRRELLFRGAHVIPYPLATTVSNTVMFDGAISTLLQYSLVDANEQAVSMHRLVAAVTRDRLSDEDKRRWAEVALRLINDAFAFESIDVNTWGQCSALMPHVMVTTAYAEALNIAPEVTSSLLNEAGRYLLRNGRFKESLDLLERALNLTRKARGDKHPTVSAIVNDLGRVHMRLGNLAEARHYYEWALGIDEPTYGHDHPHVATIVNNYGMCLMASGDADNALKHFEWALTVYRSRFGDKHPKTASTLSNLGYARMKLGQLEAARAHFEQALAVAEATLGTSHPTVGSIRHNLGTVLRMLGNHHEAREHFERALAIDQAAYIPTHPDVVRDIDSLGETLVELGEIQAAREHYQKAIANVQKLHGNEHARIKELEDLLAKLPQ